LEFSADGRPAFARGAARSFWLKVQVYADNWGEAEILEDDIHKVEVEDLGRRVDLAWASFPCQDLSMAGNGLGIGQASGASRTRSGTFWAFIDLMKNLKANGRLLHARLTFISGVVCFDLTCAIVQDR
jgi:hypothetical protein